VRQLIPEDMARLALRRLFAAYLVLSGSALLFPHRPREWVSLALLHLVGVLVLLQVHPVRDVSRRMARRWPRVSTVVADWYALAVMPLLYAELAILNASVYDGRFFDAWVQAWEVRLFGGQPSQELAAAYPIPILSEILHFCYLSYYLIIFGPPIFLYLRGRIGDHQRVVFALMLTFFGHYLFFVFLPVQGPRYLFAPPGGELARGVMYRLAHAVLEAGSSQGAAFPSSHVGVAVAQTAMAFLVWRRAAPALVVASAGLAVGAVYGGFHYATDVICGLALGLALFAAAPWVASWLGGGKGDRWGSVGRPPPGRGHGPGVV
jgi:membrane-associated phospholipid phosphatase